MQDQNRQAVDKSPSLRRSGRAFAALKKHIRKFARVSVSGGALGPNTSIEKERVKRLGKKMALCLDINLAHYGAMPENTGTKDTGKYKIQAHPEDLISNTVRIKRRGRYGYSVTMLFRGMHE